MRINWTYVFLGAVFLIIFGIVILISITTHENYMESLKFCNENGFNNVTDYANGNDFCYNLTDGVLLKRGTGKIYGQRFLVGDVNSGDGE